MVFLKPPFAAQAGQGQNPLFFSTTHFNLNTLTSLYNTPSRGFPEVLQHFTRVLEQPTDLFLSPRVSQLPPSVGRVHLCGRLDGSLLQRDVSGGLPRRGLRRGLHLRQRSRLRRRQRLLPLRSGIHGESPALPLPLLLLLLVTPQAQRVAKVATPVMLHTDGEEKAAFPPAGVEPLENKTVPVEGLVQIKQNSSTQLGQSGYLFKKKKTLSFTSACNKRTSACNKCMQQAYKSFIPYNN